ncbi:unnamed protein product [Ectocarpus sp. CCAP 1310/34]|nr:unnamed protein product [Ectocarpus sp. CCAP 1310/34]
MGNKKKSRKIQEVHFQEEEGDQQQLVDFEPEGEDEEQHVLPSPTGLSSPSPSSSSSSLSEDEGNRSHRSSDDDDGVDRLSSLQLLEATCKEEVKAYLRALRRRQTPPELSPATVAWQQRLLTESVPASSSVATASATSSRGASSRGASATSTPAVASTAVATESPVRTFLQAATVSISAADLRSVPKLTGDRTENVIEILKHFRTVVGLKAAAVNTDSSFADGVALKHVALVGTGEVLTLIQQILSGQIDCSKASTFTEPEEKGSFPPLTTWDAMCSVLLDSLLPANSVEEEAHNLATFVQGPQESVSSYALRFRTVMARFQAAVERDGSRTAWNCMTE